MPIDKIVAWASVIVAGIMLTHPFSWRMKLAKLEYSMFKEISDTRSWGNPSIFKHEITRRGRHE